MQLTNGHYYLRGDLHIHSHYSDGDRLEKVLVQAVRQGLDFIAIADHDTIEGYLAARTMVAELGIPLIVIPAIEVTGPGCHLLAYNVTRDVKNMGTARDICRSIRSAGGFVCAAHPCWQRTRHSFWDNGVFFDLVENKDLDGIELINHCANFDEEGDARQGNLPVIDYYLQHPLPITVGSDAHSSDAVGCVHIGVLAEDFSATAILHALFKARQSIVHWHDCYYGNTELLPIMPPASRQLHPMLQTERRLNTDNISFSLADPEHYQQVYLPEAFTYNTGTVQKTDGFLPCSAPFFARTASGLSGGLLESAPLVELTIRPALIANTVQLQLGIKRLAPLTGQALKASLNLYGKTIHHIIGPEEEEITFADPPLQSDGTDNHYEIWITTMTGTAVFHDSRSMPVAMVSRNQFSQPLTLQKYHLKEGGETVTASFQCLWDASALKLKVTVYDDKFCQPYHGHAIYMGDSIQLGLDPTCSRCEFNLLDQTVWELGLAQTTEGPAIVDFDHPKQCRRDLVDDMTLTIDHDKSHYTYLLEIPWQALQLTPHSQLVMGFTLLTNINDGNGFRGVLEWTSGIYDRKCAASWGWLILA